MQVGRFAASLDVPTPNQRIAADADGDGIITSYDATLIARFAAGLSGTGNVGNWAFMPESRFYAAFSASQSGQDYNAVLIGDPNNSWMPGRPQTLEPDALVSAKSGSHLTDSLVSILGQPGEPDSASRSKRVGAVNVSLPAIASNTGEPLNDPGRQSQGRNSKTKKRRLDRLPLFS